MPTEKIQVPITDIGFLRGFGIFDYVKIYDGVPFLLKEHLDRLKRSAKIMGLKIPKSDTEITDIIHKLLKKYKAPRAAIRIILTGGRAQGLGFETGKETCIIATEVLKDLPAELYIKGAKLMTYEHERVFPEVKTLNYITAVRLQKERARKNAVEILYTHEGSILEATTSNFFFIKDNTIVTSDRGILIGTVRNHVLKLAQKLGFTIEERRIMLDELSNIDEAFITATNKEVLPIIAIDGKKIGDGKVGEKVKILMNNFQLSVKTYVEQRRPRN
ncbi:MAG: amino acid aminotransferase [Candidatus Paceibacter sp.]|nr:amino acid aminotransferase [Candidatus Paceibacter sp.]